MLLEQMGERVRKVLSSQLLVLNCVFQVQDCHEVRYGVRLQNLKLWVLPLTLGLPLVHSDLHTQKSARIYVFLHCQNKYCKYFIKQQKFIDFLAYF